MRRLAIASLLFGILGMTAGAAFAQSVGATNGAINGRVTDASSGVMPLISSTMLCW